MTTTEFIDWMNREGHWMYVIIAVWLVYQGVIGIIKAIGEAVARARGHKARPKIEYRYGRDDEI
jgi:uncharacterized membrane protein